VLADIIAMQKIFIVIVLFIYSCQDVNKQLSLTGIYEHSAEGYKEELEFESDSLVVFNFYPVDSAMIGSDCLYYLNKDSLFIASFDHSIQGHKIHLTVSDTFLLTKGSSLIRVSTKETFIKKPK
jgi:hypothetical protein